MIRRAITTVAATGLCLGAFAAPAAAQPPRQEGLINVNLSDINAQVPIAVAANICGVTVAVLVSELREGPVDCEAIGGSDATVEESNPGPGGPRQRGLVNVNASDVNVQIPVGVAANVCGVTVGVLVDALGQEGVTCTTDADGNAVVTPA